MGRDSKDDSFYTYPNEEEKPTKKLRGTAVFRQELKNHVPICNKKCAMYFFLALFVILLGFGLPILLIAMKIEEIIVDYSECTNQSCKLEFEVKNKMKAPNYIYYEIHGFFIGHRDFVKSKIFKQLRGEIHVDSSGNKDCDGAIFISEIFYNDTSKFKTYTGEPLSGSDYANPCGLIARSMFNDTNFKLTDTNSNEIFINETEITNDYDRKYNFKRIENSTKVQWIDVENEHFINWMQMEPMEKFRKLWGRVDTDLESGKYYITLDNNWDVTKFKGKKKLVLLGSSKIGSGKFFGIVLCGGAGYSLILFFVFFLNRNNNRMYSIEELKWD